MKSVGLVIPIANEEKTIKKFTESMLKEFKKLNNYRFSIFYVMDSFSKDNTEKIISGFESDEINVLYNESSTGLVSCYIYGYKYCLSKDFDYIVEMDSGFSHRPEHLKNFLIKLDEGCDAVFGSRFMKGSHYETSLFRKIVSKMGTFVANVWLNMDYSDATSGYQAYKKETLQEFEFDNFISFGGMFQTEIKYYVYDKRKEEIEREYNQTPYYESHFRNFFSRRFFSRDECYKYKIDYVPINYIMSDSSFRLSWVFKGIKILFNLKDNVKNVYRRKDV